MNIALKTLIIAIGIAALGSSAEAAKGGKGKKNKATPEAPQLQPATLKSPSDTLAAFLGANLDRLLAPLDTGIPPTGNEVKVIKISPATRSAVTTLDQRFRGDAGAATQTDQPVYQRAVSVTTTLTQLMDERERQASLFINSRTTRSLSDLEKQKTRHQRKDARQEIHETKNFMSTGLEQQWLQTAARYRQQVNAQMDLLRAAERQAKPTTGAQ